MSIETTVINDGNEDWTFETDTETGQVNISCPSLELGWVPMRVLLDFAGACCDAHFTALGGCPLYCQHSHG